MDAPNGVIPNVINTGNSFSYDDGTHSGQELTCSVNDMCRGVVHTTSMTLYRKIMIIV